MSVHDDWRKRARKETRKRQTPRHSKLEGVEGKASYFFSPQIFSHNVIASHQEGTRAAVGIEATVPPMYTGDSMGSMDESQLAFAEDGV